MKHKEKLATDYMATHTKHYKTIPKEDSWTGGDVIISTYDPQIKEAFLAGFEAAKNDCLKEILIPGNLPDQIRNLGEEEIDE